MVNSPYRPGRTVSAERDRVMVCAAVANAIYNATGVRVRDYPITLDKHLDQLGEVV